jgi:cytochrome c biogenesis factor
MPHFKVPVHASHGAIEQTASSGMENMAAIGGWNMAAEAGSFALILALFTSLTQSIVPVAAMKHPKPAIAAFVRQAALSQFLFITIAFACLTYPFITSDFSGQVVAANSHTLKPLLYKISGVWGNRSARSHFSQKTDRSGPGSSRRPDSSG